MVILIISWSVSTIIEGYYHFIRESIQCAERKGEWIIGWLPVIMMSKNRRFVLKSFAIILPIILFVITYSKYGFWIGIITAISSTIIAYSFGQFLVIHNNSLYEKNKL
jgi:hypothetical protein